MPDTQGTQQSRPPTFRKTRGTNLQHSPELSKRRCLSKRRLGGWAGGSCARLAGTEPCLWWTRFLPGCFPKNPGWMLLAHSGTPLLLLTCRISVASGFTSPLGLSAGSTASGPPCRNQTYLPESDEAPVLFPQDQPPGMPPEHLKHSPSPGLPLHHLP